MSKSTGFEVGTTYVEDKEGLFGVAEPYKYVAVERKGADKGVDIVFYRYRDYSNEGDLVTYRAIYKNDMEYIEDILLFASYVDTYATENKPLITMEMNPLEQATESAEQILNVLTHTAESETPEMLALKVSLLENRVNHYLEVYRKLRHYAEDQKRHGNQTSAMED